MMFDKFGTSLTCLIMAFVFFMLSAIPFIGPLFLFFSVASVAAAIFGPLFNIKLLRKPCPYCESEVVIASNKKGVTCKACQQRIVIKAGEFVKI